jgi:hypothetical protein
MAIMDEEEFVASAVVYPSTTEEVQSIVLWANKHKVPIFPISMGRNRRCLRTLPVCPHLNMVADLVTLVKWDTAEPRRECGDQSSLISDDE